MHRGLSLAAVVLVLASGCVNGYLVNRDLHYVVDEEGNEQLVRTDSPPPAAYEAYLRARFALEGTPPDLELAHEQIRIALRWRPREAQLWLVLAEVEWRAGEVEAAEAAMTQALELEPGFSPKVDELRARMAKLDAEPRPSTM